MRSGILSWPWDAPALCNPERSRYVEKQSQRRGSPGATSCVVIGVSSACARHPSFCEVRLTTESCQGALNSAREMFRPTTSSREASSTAPDHTQCFGVDCHVRPHTCAHRTCPKHLRLRTTGEWLSTKHCISVRPREVDTPREAAVVIAKNDNQALSSPNLCVHLEHRAALINGNIGIFFGRESSIQVYPRLGQRKKQQPVGKEKASRGRLTSSAPRNTAG